MLLDEYPVPNGPTGTDWVDLSVDQCTVYYTSEGADVRRYDLCRVDARQMIRDDFLELREPEIRDGRQHDAFARNRIRQYDVERGDAVRREDQQAFRVDAVDVAHFAAHHERQAREIRLE